MESSYAYVMEQLGLIERARRSILTYQEVADGAGESKRTVEKIARKEILDPGQSHCQNIASFFRELEQMPGDTQREKFEALMTKRQQKAAA